MIVPELILGDILGKFDRVFVNRRTFKKLSYYYYVSEQDVNQFLSATKDAYPLALCLIGEDTHTREGFVDRELQIVLAITEPKAELLNTHRFEKSFKYVLHPLAEQIKDALWKDYRVNFIRDNEMRVQRFPNYEPVSSDVWDALRITINVQFNNKTKQC